MAAQRSPSPKSEALAPPSLRVRLAEYAETFDIDLIFLDPAEYFDDAIVGIVHGFGQESCVLYDEGKVIAAMIESGMSPEDAQEFFEFNTIGAYLGEATPRFLLLKAEDA